MERGKNFMMRSAAICERPTERNGARRRASLIHNRSRRPKKGAPWLRRGEESLGPQEAHPRRHARTDLGRRRSRGRRPGSRRCETRSESPHRRLSPDPRDLGRWWVRRRLDRLGRNNSNSIVDTSRDRQTFGPLPRIQGSSKTVDCRTNVRLVESLSAP